MKHPLFESIDFNKLGSYEEFEEKTTSGDRLVMECKKEVQVQMQLNEQMIEQTIHKYSLIAHQTIQQDLHRTLARLTLLSKQLKHYYKINDY